MKTLLLIAATLLSLNSQAFQVQARCQLQAGQSAICQVCNNSYQAVYCNMSLQGRTSRGFWLNEFGNGYLAPGQCMTGYLYAHDPYTDPLINANGQANCSF